MFTVFNDVRTVFFVSRNASDRPIDTVVNNICQTADYENKKIFSFTIKTFAHWRKKNNVTKGRYWRHKGTRVLSWARESKIW